MESIVISKIHMATRVLHVNEKTPNSAVLMDVAVTALRTPQMVLEPLGCVRVLLGLCPALAHCRVLIQIC